MTDFRIKRSNASCTYFRGVDLPIPCKEDFNKYKDIWNNKYNNEFSEYNNESLIDVVFSENNHSNKLYKEMYLKCVLLDKLYSTNIKYMNDLVFHLTQISDLKEKINFGNIDTVKEMQAVKLKNGKIINYISFASKYCNRYNPNSFPIYDTIVKEVLLSYISKLDYLSAFKTKNLSDYFVYKQVIDEFIKNNSYISNYKEFDVYMWTMGKEKLEGLNLIKKLNSGEEKFVIKKLGFSNQLTKTDLWVEVVNKYGLK